MMQMNLRPSAGISFHVFPSSSLITDGIASPHSRWSWQSFASGRIFAWLHTQRRALPSGPTRR